MIIEFISQTINDLRKEHLDADPFELVKAMGFLLLFQSMGKAKSACKGFCMTQCGQTSITINSDLPKMVQKIICAHELGHTHYVRAVTRKTLAAGAGRIIAPGIKFDTIPVIIGGQGIGKSTLLSKLGKQWYSDSLSIADMKDKTAPEKLQGNWLLELSELAGIKKMDVETVKSFASRIDDKYRPSYGRVVESHPRQCIIVGTTNSDGGFLRDVTGNRRFWPIQVSGEGTKRPWDITEYEVDQIWAEAVANFRAGEELFLKGSVAEAAADAQRSAMETDDREGLVAAYLDTLLPEDWDTTDIHRRQEYIRDTDDPTRPVGTVRRMQVSHIEIWCECFGRPRDSIKKSDSYEIEAILRSLGNWEKYSGNKTGKRSIPIYGLQRVYLRTE